MQSNVPSISRNFRRMREGADVRAVPSVRIRDEVLAVYEIVELAIGTSSPGGGERAIMRNSVA
jgi:hypothetical protein